MNEKPVKLPMDFGEALARIAQTPKAAVDRIERRSKAAKTKAGRSPPRSGSRKTA